MSAALVARGASVVLADLDGAGAQRAAEELHAGPPGRASSAALDVGIADAVTELVGGRLRQDHGHLDLCSTTRASGSAARWST